MYPVRNSVKAIIIRDNKLLCVQKKDEHGFYFLLPGGGQDKNETFKEAVRRECREELGAEIEVGELKYIREYIGKNHEFADTDDAHQVEFMFECTLLGDVDEALATNKDIGQTGIVWVEITEGDARVYPKVLIERLHAKFKDLYWGDVN